MRRGGHRAVAYRGERGRVRAGRHPGPFLEILRRGRTAVVVGRHHPIAERHRRDPRAPGVPPARRAAQRGAVPGPGHAVLAGRVLGGHLVGVERVGQRVARRPQVPPAAVVADHRVLHAGLGVARQDHLPPPDVELGGMRGLGHLHPPVLGPGCRAAQVQPPAPVRRADQGRPFQRLGAQLVLADAQQRLEAHAVRGPGHRDGVAAALADGPPQPVGQEDLPVAGDRARRPGPVPRPGSWRANRDGAVLRPGQEHQKILSHLFTSN